MSGSQHLRLFIEDRLTAAAVEIFGVVEKTISEYEEQVVQSKREVEQLKQDIRHLSTVKTHIQMCRTDSQPVSKELFPLELNPRPELMSCQEDVAVQHQSPQVKEEQVDLSIIPDPETSFYNCGPNGFDMSESTSDSQLIPSYTTETATASHDVANRYNKSDGSDLTFSQRDADMYCIEQKICRFCRKQFRSYAELIKHVEESHIGQRAFKCPVCSKEFARRDKFSIHYRIHTGEKRHSCPVCGKSFTQRSNCIIHMRTHSGVKPHSCPVCRKLFAQSSNLNLHMRTHTGAKPHFCPYCGKTFTDSSSLKVHVRIHTGVRPYSCQVCGKGFNQNANLKVHMRTHAGRGAGEGEDAGGQY